MPKSIVVDPRETRKPGTLSFTDIPLNAYVLDMKKELKAHGKDALVRVYRDMVVIREFETMLNTIKTKGAYQGIAYDHLGPAHLSIGQESAVVGQCMRRWASRTSSSARTAATARSSPSAFPPRRGFPRQARRHHGDLLRRSTSCAWSRRAHRSGACATSPWTSSSTASWPRSSAGRTASTRAWAARCTPSSRRSAACRTTPSSAARRTSPSVQPCSSGSTGSPASSSPTSATAPRPAARCGKP